MTFKLIIVTSGTLIKREPTGYQLERRAFDFNLRNDEINIKAGLKGARNGTQLKQQLDAIEKFTQTEI